MKKLKNDCKTICGVKHTFFTIIKDKNSKYYYYLNSPCSSNIGDRLIYNSKSKSTIFNKYTLTLLGIIFTILQYTIIYPILAIIYPVYMYMEGAYNFIRNKTWAQHERFFNWCNIVIILTLIIYNIFT